LKQLGDYRIIREVGRGGMGVVYEAEQESLGRRVALKVLAPQGLRDPKLLLRFHHEARAAARLHHTNIVPVFGVGESEGRHYYVMQFIAGLGLDAVLDELKRLRGPWPEKEVAALPAGGGLAPAADVARSLMEGRFTPVPAQDPSEEPTAPGRAIHEVAPAPSSSVVLAGQSGQSSATDSAAQYARSVALVGVQVAEALDYAHRQGVLHRDIKPSNLMLDGRGTVWVTDFGLAKATDSDDLTRTGDIIGTVRYMAPERFAGRCDARSDVYSLGLTLYELLARRPAFERSDRAELVHQVTHDEPPRLRSLDPTIPRDLETVVRKAIERRNPAAAVAFLAMAFGTAVSTWQAIRARQANEAVRAREAEMRAVLEFVEQRVFTAARPTGQSGGLGREVTLRQALDAALPAVAQGFADQPLIEARLRRTLGHSYLYLGELRTAEEQFEASRALNVRHRGPDDPETLRSMFGLANSYHALGRQAEVLKLREETLALQKARLGPDHPDTITSMSNLATSYSVQGRHAEALKLHEETLALRNAKLGPDHPDTLVSRLGVASCLAQLGRGALAAADCLRAADVWEKLGGSDADSLYNTACFRAVTAAVLRAADESPSGAKQAEGEADRAMACLELAVAAGFSKGPLLAADHDLDALRQRADFKDLQARLSTARPK
jgi:serine/threonine protein kinase